MNGEYRGDSDIGKLVHDFNCSRADDMNFQLMADRIRYLKENTRGVIEMCQVMKNMRTESLKEIALRMLAGWESEKKVLGFIYDNGKSKGMLSVVFCFDLLFL